TPKRQANQHRTDCMHHGISPRLSASCRIMINNPFFPAGLLDPDRVNIMIAFASNLPRRYEFEASVIPKERPMARGVTLATVFSLALIAVLGENAVADPMLKDFEYPFAVRRFDFTSQKLPLSMAYMDVAPQAAPNGRTAVLLHGKNFCAATWEKTIRALAAAGYRVVAPDQIGFCKSS